MKSLELEEDSMTEMCSGYIYVCTYFTVIVNLENFHGVFSNVCSSGVSSWMLIAMQAKLTAFEDSANGR